ncbi:MAG: PocR ligand-binding domain-containing protein [Oscillospiraceae bacterium]|nr:PocR ligand-binding domain-containing protein [Oscillospiraceae bacterium]
MKNKDVINEEKILLLDLIDETTLAYLLTGFCVKFNSGMKIVYRDLKDELKIIGEIPKTEDLWSEICKVHRKTNFEVCNACDLKNAEKLFNSKNPETKYYYCESLGMIDMIAPIKIRNKVIGAVITGQRILKNEAESLLIKICNKYPDLANNYKEAFQKEKDKNQSKICSLNEINSLLSNLRSFANLIEGICRKNYDNQSNIKKLVDEKNRIESFFERVSHTLSLPMTSILIDAANLVEEIHSDDATQEDATHLFNEIQGLRLVVENILHGSSSLKTIQEGDTDFVKKHIATSLYGACEMFKAEAKEKRCDLKITIKIFDDIFPLQISDLKDINLIYKIIINKKFVSFPKETSHFIIRKQNNDLRIKNISELVEYCYLNQNEIFDVIDTVTNDKIELDFSKLSKYYLSPIEMHPEHIDLAWRNLLHNAVKYSYKTVPSSKKRYVSIKIFFDKDSVGVMFSNYGVGITAEEKDEKIYEARYRGYLSQDRNRTGAGLGLNHVKWVIETIHGGKISCTSDRQEGGAFLTKFTVKFNKYKK